VVERPQQRARGSSPRTGSRTGLPGPLPAGLGSAVRPSRRRLSPQRKRRILRSLLVLAIAVTLALGILLRGQPPNPPLRIEVQGQTQTVPARWLVRDVIVRFSLVPASGNLLDVEGKLLKRAIYPGKILVNGVAVPVDTALAQGDVVTVQPGRDRGEGVVKRVVKVPEGEVPNPQFFLGKASGQQILRVGKFSGKLVSSVFRPVGTFTPPNAVALTFDDGPSPTNTLRLLAVLNKFGVKATFFVIGLSASYHSDLLKAEIAAGMEVADHSWSHPYRPAFKDLSPRTIRNEITRAQKELLSYGASSGLFRPPGGTFSTRVIDIARRADTRLVLWSIDPKDWAPGRTARQIVNAVLSNVEPGSIILLHDGGGDRSATIAALPDIIRGIRAKGLEIVTVGEGSDL
jgi:peptidoglycan/xylan/chitin deacetylase (PgdA/CDA1 family)